MRGCCRLLSVSPHRVLTTSFADAAVRDSRRARDAPLPQEALLIGMFGAHMLSLVPMLVGLRSPGVYRWVHLLNAALLTGYMLFANVLVMMHPHALVCVIVLSLSYVYWTGGAEEAPPCDLAPFQEHMRMAWAVVTVINGIQFIFAPDLTEAMYLTPPANSDYSLSAMLCYAALASQAAALTMSSTSKLALRDSFLMLAVGWAILVYARFSDAATNLTRLYPLLMLASAYIFHL